MAHEGPARVCVDLMFRDAEHYFAKAIIVASGGSLVNKVNPHAPSVDKGLSPR